MNVLILTDTHYCHKAKTLELLAKKTLNQNILIDSPGVNVKKTAIHAITNKHFMGKHSGFVKRLNGK